MLGAFKAGVMGAAGGGADTFFADYVKLRLTMDGANGSTTFTDLSSSAHTVTANGYARVTTSTKKFGTGGLLLDGSGDYLSVPDHADWDIGSGAFTLDFWVKPDSWPATGGNPVVLFDMGYSDATSLIVSFNSASKLQIDSNLGQFLSSALTLSTSSFTHIRITWGGTGANFRALVDGVEEISTSQSSAINSSSVGIAIGARHGGTQAFDGVIDDFRLAVGAEATDTVPPSAALPIS